MRARGLLFALAALAAACTDGKVAGGYDDVENPAIRASFTDTAGNPYGPATLRVYARWQNPWKDSLPLLALPVSGGALTLRDTAVLRAFAEAQARGTPSPGKDTLEFNLAASSADGEAFLGGFLLIKRAAGPQFVRQTAKGVLYPDAKGVLPANPMLGKPYSLPKGNVGGRGLDLGLKRVFIPGSAWKSAVAPDGSFSLDRLAAGTYALKGVAVDDKIWSAQDSVIAGGEYPGSEWSEAEVIWVDSLP